MIRLLRRKRGSAKSRDEFPSPMELIEPMAPAGSEVPLEDDSTAAGGSFLEPSLKKVSAEDLDPSEATKDAGEWGNFVLRRPPTGEADDETKPTYLDVHNTSKNADTGGAEAAAKQECGERNRKAEKGQRKSEIAAGAARMPGVEDTGEENKLKGALQHTVPFRKTHLAKIEEEPSANPAFNIFANPRIWRRDERNLNYSGEVAKLYRDVFTPTRPKRSYRDFSGRREIIEMIIQAVEEERSHVILLGEKSLGKTSLLNVVADCATEAGYLVARMTCTADMTFRHFILATLEQFTARINESPVMDILQKRLGTNDLCSLVEPDGELDVPAAIEIFRRLSEHQAIVLVDDFERVENEQLKIRIRELMSVTSDQGAWLSLMLFGRASRAGEILTESYQSLSNVTWIKLRPLTDEDCARIVTRGVSSVGVQFSDEVTEAIIRLSQGIPIAIQWLCLLVIRHATQRYASEVEMHDLAEIIETATSKIDSKLSAFYDQLCGPTRCSWADDLLYLAVQAPTDQNGVFSAITMSRLSQKAVGKPLLELPLHSALSRFVDEDGESVLEKVWTSSGTCYRFVNPAMRAIVMLKNSRRMANMPEALSDTGETIDLLPLPNRAPGTA